MGYTVTPEAAPGHEEVMGNLNRNFRGSWKEPVMCTLMAFFKECQGQLYVSDLII